jgi:hypothetical protein
MCIDEILIRLRVRRIADARVTNVKKTSTPILKPLTPMESEKAAQAEAAETDITDKVSHRPFSILID